MNMNENAPVVWWPHLLVYGNGNGRQDWSPIFQDKQGFTPAMLKLFTDWHYEKHEKKTST
jgi:hypothetical protein